MFTEQEKQRMELAKRNRAGTNCIGTILYVLGVSDEDTYIGSGEKRWSEGIVDKLLDNMTKINNPQKGAVLVVRESRIEHMGIIIEENPTKVYHRPGCDMGIKPDESLDETLKYYSNLFAHSKIEYYIRK